MKKIILFFIVLLSMCVTNLQAQWTQIGLDIDGEAIEDHSGTSVSISSNGKVVAIGAIDNAGNGSNAGHVRVLKNIAGVWTQIGTDIDGETAGDRFGNSVSLSSDGSIVAIGAPYNNGNGISAGHVRVFQNIGGVWTQIGLDIDGEASGDQSGNSVSLSSDGSIVAIGAFKNNGNGANSGHVRIYQNISGIWVQVGADINGESLEDRSGISVSLNSDGTIVAIGAERNAGNGINAGHVRIYQNTGGTWIQIGTDIDGESANSLSGVSVSLNANGTIVAIGANFNTGTAVYSGHARVYQNTGGTWTQIGADIDGEGSYNKFGGTISLNSDGTIVAIGAESNNGNGTNSGHARVYQYTGSIWTQIWADIDGEASGDYSGNSVNLSSDGTIVIIGAKNNDGNGYQSGHVRVYKNCTQTITGTDVQTACNNYTWIDGNTYTSNNSTATHTLLSSVGCDSIVTLNLTLNTIDVTTGISGITITANQSGATYQWIDCSNGNTIIIGATNQNFTAITNGDYSVIVSQGGCSDTSICVTVSTVSIEELLFGTGIKLYPNPTTNLITLALGELTDVQIRITDLSGKIVYTNNQVNNQNLNISMEGFADGSYLLEVISGENKRVINLIKQ